MSVAVMRIIPVDDHRVLSHWFCSEVLSCSVSVCISCELFLSFFVQQHSSRDRFQCLLSFAVFIVITD